MNKIISLFRRNYETDHLVSNEVVPGAEWVLAGEGTPTRKWNGTCCMVRDGVLYKRYEVKRGKNRPPLFTAATDTDPITGKTQGWVPVSADSKEDKWSREAWREGIDLRTKELFRNGTYELCGPKVQGNPEDMPEHHLISHGAWILTTNPRTFDEIKEYFRLSSFEGIVWHHEDGRMVKIKATDFWRNQ